MRTFTNLCLIGIASAINLGDSTGNGPCQNGRRWDLNLEDWVTCDAPACEPGEIWDEHTGTCTGPPESPKCEDGSEWNAEIQECRRINKRFLVECGEGETWEENLEICVPSQPDNNEGSTKDGTGSNWRIVTDMNSEDDCGKFVEG